MSSEIKSSEIVSSQIRTSQPSSSDAGARPNRIEEALAIEEDARLRNDIRLLGRVLGDTVRDQEGDDVFDLVERIRQTSIRFHRDEDRLARSELETILDSMSISQTVLIVRAFSYFSHLANIAEDQNNIRQLRARHAGAGAPSGTLAKTLQHAREVGFRASDLRSFFKTALVSPVADALMWVLSGVLLLLVARSEADAAVTVADPGEDRAPVAEPERGDRPLRPLR